MKYNGNTEKEPGLHPGSTGWARRLVNGFGKLYGTLFYSVETYGLEKLPVEGSVLILVKHQRNDDIPVGLAKGLYKIRYTVWAIMKDSLAAPHYLGFFLRCGGIPLNRTDPKKSKKQLLYARKVLNLGNALVIFPEQTTVPYKMGRGRVGGFRFIVGKPKDPLNVICLGMEYVPRKWGRTKLVMRMGDPRSYHGKMDPEAFMHDCMLEIARLSNLEYPYKLQHDTDEVGGSPSDQEST